ncbi:ABC transporter substrate-binding protein [Tardiphaga sp. 804_B3_N1_9]|uniref:ABC transporter substrate-binding protein n=1 Tax=Tardiphaga sp. 804_B3_N1_9 TaxID=3240786 RepID=UPI003F277007
MSLLVGGAVAAGSGFVSAEEQPRRGGILVAVIAPTEPISLTVTSDTAGPTVIASTKIFDGLIEIGPDGQPRPSLAKSWAISSDGKEVVFKLREGVRWHDGALFTASDVKFSFDEIWKKLAPRGKSSFANVYAVEAPDALTAVFKLSHPSPVIFSVLNAGESQILPRHLYEGTDIVRNPHNQRPVGTGPFRFKEWLRGDRIVLERNPDYWDAGKPYLDGVVFRVIPDIATRAAGFETGDIQYGSLSPISASDLERLQNNPGLVINFQGYEWLGPRIGMEFNLRRPVLSNVLVRRAIAHAIDLKALSRVVLRNQAKPGSGLISSSQPQFAAPDVKPYEFDPKLAERLLDEAGFPRKDDGTRFGLKLDWLPFNESFMRQGEFVRQSLKRVGINVELRGQDLPTFFKQVYTDNDFDLSIAMLMSFGDPQIGTTRLVWSKTIQRGIPWTNASGYSDPAADKLVVSIHQEADTSKRAEFVRELQRKVQADVPLIILAEPKMFTVHSKRLHGILTTPDGSYESLKDAWLAP